LSLHIFPVNFDQDVNQSTNLADILISSNKCGIEDDDILVVTQKIISNYKQYSLVKLQV